MSMRLEKLIAMWGTHVWRILEEFADSIRGYARLEWFPRSSMGVVSTPNTKSLGYGLRKIRD
ncbi:uncharacterized protein N7479_004161 [Penicillium vulpinum]|uniref:uncharacterized protein n=1 Tax=Penicillium vulpinum TaxID=29845 RepID=UPI002548A00F|nr:uncharacterized protein N7479_004161 [Penicillium vulpinum]KAJ5964285.1 hypothetical protein N7479_004161 [Penicillium vulpinum]